MKKITDFIIETIAYAIIGVDNLLYRFLGIVSPLRRSKWHNDAYKIQQKLDYEHSEASWYNRVNGSYLTTKAVMKVIRD